MRWLCFFALLTLMLNIVACSSSEDVKVKYLSNGFYCQGIGDYYSLLDCENVMTGKKVARILNATNIIEVEE